MLRIHDMKNVNIVPETITPVAKVVDRGGITSQGSPAEAAFEMNSVTAFLFFVSSVSKNKKEDLRLRPFRKCFKSYNS